MDERLTRQRAVRMLPVTAVSPTRQIAGGVFLIMLGAAIALFPVAFLRLHIVIGTLVGIGLYLAVRGPVQRSGMFASGMVVLDRDGMVRVAAGIAAVTRASRQFTDRWHFRREILLGLGIVVAFVVASIVLILSGVGLASVGMVLALLGAGMAEGGLGVVWLGRRRRAASWTMLDGLPMVVLLAAYLHLGGRPDELESGVPAERLVERLAEADDATLLTAHKFIRAWSRLQQQITSGGV